MTHDRRGAGQPVIVYNPGASMVTAFPGSMIAPADGTRRLLVIQATSIAALVIYARSGSDPGIDAGITLFPQGGSVVMTDEEDPDMVVAEWWGYTNSVNNCFLSVITEVFR